MDGGGGITMLARKRNRNLSTLFPDGHSTTYPHPSGFLHRSLREFGTAGEKMKGTISFNYEVWAASDVYKRQTVFLKVWFLPSPSTTLACIQSQPLQECIVESWFQ